MPVAGVVDWHSRSLALIQNEVLTIAYRCGTGRQTGYLVSSRVDDPDGSP